MRRQADKGATNTASVQRWLLVPRLLFLAAGAWWLAQWCLHLFDHPRLWRPWWGNAYSFVAAFALWLGAGSWDVYRFLGRLGRGVTGASPTANTGKEASGP